MDIFFFNQLIDDFVAHSVNIHRTAGNKVFQRLFTLRSANQATGTAGNRFTFHTLNVRTTYRTMRREYNLTGIFRAFRKHDVNHLRDHVASAANHHFIANA